MLEKITRALDPYEFVGWYDDPAQTTPAHMPKDPPCPVCTRPLGNIHDAKWTSLMWANERGLSLFYGVHSGCVNEPREHIEESIMSWTLADDWQARGED